MNEDNFPSFTTCGYNTLKTGKCADEITDFVMQACFVYNDYELAISLDGQNDLYHTFNASTLMHQTFVPIIEHNYLIYFNHTKYSVFVWGN